ncbi:unnamed protein product [Discula destructiva]
METTTADEEDLDELEVEVIHYMQICVEQKERAEGLSSELVAATQDRDRLQLELEQLRSKDKSRISEKSAGEYEEAIKQLRDTIVQLESSLDTANSELAQSRQAAEEMQETHAQACLTLQAKIQDAEGEIEGHKSKVANIQHTSETLDQLVKAQAAELEQTRASNESLTEELSIVRSSLSKSFAALEDVKAQHSSELATKLETMSNEKNRFADELIASKLLVGTLQTEISNHIETSEHIQKEQEVIKQRVRAVVVCVDLSGSVESSGLVDGIKKFYRHLIGYLKDSAGQTCAMVILHGGKAKKRTKRGGHGDVRILANVHDDWVIHEKALVLMRAAGHEEYCACLRTVQREMCDGNLMASDVQVVLLGDGEGFESTSRWVRFDQDHTEQTSLCQELSAMSPPVPIHSIVVQQDNAAGNEDSQIHTGWYTWDYSARTNGKTMRWKLSDPLPDMDEFLL